MIQSSISRLVGKLEKVSMLASVPTSFGNSERRGPYGSPLARRSRYGEAKTGALLWEERPECVPVSGRNVSICYDFTPAW